MKRLFKNGTVYFDGKLKKADLLIDGSTVTAVGSDAISPDIISDASVSDISGKYIFPGFSDVHVHLREPGFSYKETVASGSASAARGGYTNVCAMPNLNPVPDSAENLAVSLDIIRRDALVNVYPYGAITVGQKGQRLAAFEEMAGDVVAFSDDGRGVQDEGMMLDAMKKAAALGKIIAAHCEVDKLLHGGIIHDGDYAREHSLPGICSESEYEAIRRDIELVKQTGCAYHVCHVSAKESVELIRNAKAEGVNITAETAPHYLVLDDRRLQDDGGFKMNPPIRAKEDRAALIDAVIDGTIDMIATDHAPHSAEEKSRGLYSVNGIVGLETAFPVLYTGLVRRGVITLERLVYMLTDAARLRFGIGSAIAPGQNADICVYDLDEIYTVNPDDFLSLGRSTPFGGMKVRGRCLETLCGGKTVWKYTE